MVLYIMKWDIHPDKAEAYLKWTEGAIKKTLGVKGVVEFRAYRPVSGDRQAVVTYEFPDMATRNVSMKMRHWVREFSVANSHFP
jgi:hypothetical protein